MKFRKFGRITLALAASLLIGFGTQSCHYDYTEAYIIVTGSQYNQVASYREDNETGVLHAAPHDPLSSGGTNPIRARLLTGGRYVYVLNQGKPTISCRRNHHLDRRQCLRLQHWRRRRSWLTSSPIPARALVRSASPSAPAARFSMSSMSTSREPLPTPPPASPTISAATPCYDSASGVYRPAGDITVFSIDSSTGRLFLVQNQQQQNAQGSPLSYFPVGCFPIDFHLAASYLYTAEASDPATGNTQVVYAYNAATTGQLLQVPGGAQPITGARTSRVIGGSANGSWIYILDSGTNMIYTFTQGGNGLLSAITGGAFPNFSGAAGMSALTTDSGSKFLYVANTQSPGLNQSGSVISAFNITGNTGDLTTLRPRLLRHRIHSRLHLRGSLAPVPLYCGRRFQHRHRLADRSQHRHPDATSAKAPRSPPSEPRPGASTAPI